MIEINGILYSDDMKLLINCSNLTMSGNLVIPKRVEYISPQAFQGSNLNSITLPDSLLYIGEQAFRDCQYLESIDFGHGDYKTLEKETFFNCFSLRDITIPKSIQRIGESCFQNCALKSVKFHEGIKVIEPYAFWPEISVAELDIPDSVKYIHPKNFTTLQTIRSNSYVEGLADICIHSACLTEYIGEHGSIYIPPTKSYYSRYRIDRYMKAEIDSISYIYRHVTGCRKYMVSLLLCNDDIRKDS